MKWQGHILWTLNIVTENVIWVRHLKLAKCLAVEADENLARIGVDFKTNNSCSLFNGGAKALRSGSQCLRKWPWNASQHDGGLLFTVVIRRTWEPSSRACYDFLRGWGQVHTVEFTQRCCELSTYRTNRSNAKITLRVIAGFGFAQIKASTSPCCVTARLLRSWSRVNCSTRGGMLYLLHFTCCSTK